MDDRRVWVLMAAGWAVVVLLLVVVLLRVDHLGRQVAYICDQAGGIGFIPTWTLPGFTTQPVDPEVIPMRWGYWPTDRVCEPGRWHGR